MATFESGLSAGRLSASGSASCRPCSVMFPRKCGIVLARLYSHDLCCDNNSLRELPETLGMPPRTWAYDRANGKMRHYNLLPRPFSLSPADDGNHRAGCYVGSLHLRKQSGSCSAQSRRTCRCAGSRRGLVFGIFDEKQPSASQGTARCSVRASSNLQQCRLEISVP